MVSIPPARLVALFPLIVLPLIVRGPPLFGNAAAGRRALFPLIVQAEMVNSPRRCGLPRLGRSCRRR